MNMKKKQSGAVLVVSLIMLVLLTLIGLDSIQTTLIEEKIYSLAGEKFNKSI